MPEFPEVHTIVEILNEEIKNKTIQSVNVLYNGTIKSDLSYFVENLKDKTFNYVTQIGKFIIFHLSDNYVLISHLRMEGKYSLLAKELVKITTPLRATTHTFSVAVLVAAPAAFIASGMPSVTIHDALIVLYLGVIVTGVAYLLYGTALKTTSASTCVALGLLEPVTAFILAIVVVGEAVNAGACLGLVAILGGLYFVLRSEQAPIEPKLKVATQNA